jgi:hypothetical protein
MSSLIIANKSALIYVGEVFLLWNVLDVKQLCINNRKIKRIPKRIFDEGEPASLARLTIFTVSLGQMSSLLCERTVNTMHISQQKSLTGRQPRNRS